MIEIYVDMDTVAQHLRGNPEDLMQLLGILAGSLSDEQGPDSFARGQYCAKVAASHEGNVADQDVAPFLLQLAEKLQAAEKAMQP